LLYFKATAKLYGIDIVYEIRIPPGQTAAGFLSEIQAALVYQPHIFVLLTNDISAASAFISQVLYEV
jgi:hypothetical protein